MTTDRHFRLLYEAALDDPADALALSALADWHEDAGMPHQAALLRLAVSLREVPYPDEPDEACRRFWIERQFSPIARLSAQDYVSLKCWYPNIRVDINSPVCDWPGCHGWHGAGRLPGFAAAYRLLAHPQFSLAQSLNLAAMRRHVLRGELYSCWVIGVKERDAEWKTHDDALEVIRAGVEALRPNYWEGSWPGWQDMADLWRLRGGKAGGAVNVMIRHEVTVTRFAGSSHRDSLLALTRTYHRDLLRCFAAGEPWVHGRGVYETRKVRKPV